MPKIGDWGRCGLIFAVFAIFAKTASKRKRSTPCGWLGLGSRAAGFLSRGFLRERRVEDSGVGGLSDFLVKLRKLLGQFLGQRHARLDDDVGVAAIRARLVRAKLLQVRVEEAAAREGVGVVGVQKAAHFGDRLVFGDGQVAHLDLLLAVVGRDRHGALARVLGHDFEGGVAEKLDFDLRGGFARFSGFVFAVGLLARDAFAVPRLDLGEQSSLVGFGVGGANENPRKIGR